MSLETRLTEFATQVGDDMQAALAAIGTLANLNTTQKNSLVAAINEVLAAVANGSSIDDENISTASAWSSSKTTSEITAAINNFVAGAPDALDTWQELVAELQDQDSAVSGLVTAVGNRIRYDAAQELTAPQQLQASQNIGVGNPEVDLVAVYVAARDA